MKLLFHFFSVFGFLLFFFNGKLLNAQSGTLYTAGARGAGMANATVAFTDINSAFANQAGLAYIETLTATAFAEQRFLLSDLQTVSAAVALPTASGTFGLSVHHFGQDIFRQQRFGLAYGRALTENLSLGAQVLLLHTSIAEYGSRTNLTFEMGLLTRLLPGLQLGFHIYSPMRVELVNGEDLPVIFRLGAAYLPSERMTLTAEVEKDIDFPARTKLGIEYRAVERLHLRTGVATNPTNVSFGFGYRLDSGLSFDIASVYHQWLGFTPTAGITFQQKP